MRIIPFNFMKNTEDNSFILRNSITYNNGRSGNKTYTGPAGGDIKIIFTGSTDSTYDFSGYTISGTTTVTNSQTILPIRSGTYSNSTIPIIKRDLIYNTGFGSTPIPIVSRYRLYKSGVLIESTNTVVSKVGNVTAPLYFTFGGISLSFGDGISVVTEDILFNVNVAPISGVLTISGITSTTAVGTSEIINPGDSFINVTANGVCWSTSPNPTTANSKTDNGAQNNYFVYSTNNITGLSSATTYYVRGYATNGIGTTYTNEVTFTTL
jgi:hypothetical protein